MEFLPCWVFPARSSWTSGCFGSRPQILGCSGFLRLRSSRCRLWQSAVSLTPPSPLHTDCRLAGWCWSVLEQLEVTSSVPPERAAALMGLNSTLTSCFFHLAGQKLLLIGCCLSVSPVIGQTQLHVSAGVVLHLCLSQSPAVTLVVVLPLRIRLCRESPSDQSRTPPAGRPALLHLWRKTQQHRWDAWRWLFHYFTLSVFYQKYSPCSHTSLFCDQPKITRMISPFIKGTVHTKKM